MTPSPPPPPPHHLSRPTNNGLPPPHLKISHHSHSIKKPSSPSPPHRTPVIIYTHSPKIIHTNPRDFMALVQKLTGMSRSSNYHHRMKPENESNKNVKVNDEESSSVITTEEISGGGDGQVNSSCFVPPVFDPSNPYVGNMPVFAPPDLNQSYYNYDLNYNYGYDSFYFSKPNIISSSSSSALEGLNEFP